MTGSTRRRLGKFASAGVVTALCLATVACSSDSEGSKTTTKGNNEGGGGKKIALLLPESKTTRYESFDRPLFEKAVKADCSDCEILYSNADQDAAKQQDQAEAALTDGAKVLVLDPVDSEAAASIVASAKAENVPVVAYDRFLADADYYVSFDNEKVGELQGQALVDIMDAAGKAEGNIVMINGSPTDPNAGSFKKGAHSVIDESKLKVVAEFDTPDWTPEKAQDWMAGQLTTLDNKLDGVYAANDGTGGGAITAMKAAGLKPIPPTTGQDSELAAIQRIVAGEQAMTIYKAYQPEADKAAELAVALVNGDMPDGGTDVEGVPSFLLDPVVVTSENVADTIVADDLWTVDDICTAEYADACAKLGLK
jgi:D-xylose transport system substrate-binding protein